MPIDKVIRALEEERDRISKAIEILRSGLRVSGKVGPRRMSAAARQKISHAAKRRWELWRKMHGIAQK